MSDACCENAAEGAAVLAQRHRVLRAALPPPCRNPNFRFTWLCSRNDLIANAAVLVSAGVVAATGSRWPDALVGTALAALWLLTSMRPMRAIAAGR